MLKSTYKEAKRIRKTINYNHRLLGSQAEILWRLERGYQLVETGTIEDAIEHFKKLIQDTKKCISEAEKNFAKL